MSSAIDALSSAAVLSLFGVNNSAAPTNSTQTPAKPSALEVTGHTDDTFKAGKAIGKIIEIVSGMKSDSSLWTMDGAEVTDNGEAGYTETKTGQGTFKTDDDWAKKFVRDGLQKLAQGTGPQAEEVQAYLKAQASGTIESFDMSTMGVTSTMTMRNSYYADGREKGSSVSYHTQGMDAFLQKYTFHADDGTLRDKTTGKYASIGQNGTQFTYNIY